MSGSGFPSGPDRIHKIAHELCELFQQQIDDLQQGLDPCNLEQYLKHGERINKLEAQLRAMRPAP
jgi:hypothetical protein